jgi:hypothetical protein
MTYDIPSVSREFELPDLAFFSPWTSTLWLSLETLSSSSHCRFLHFRLLSAGPPDRKYVIALQAQQARSAGTAGSLPIRSQSAGILLHCGYDHWR